MLGFPCDRHTYRRMTELEDQRTAEAAHRRDASPDAFYPLTMPLTVGPGAISVAVALGSQRPKEAVDFAHLVMIAGVAIAGLAAVAVTIYICYRFAEPTIAALGKHGTNVVVRLSAFLLLCIGIQIVWTGFSELQIPSAPPHSSISGKSSLSNAFIYPTSAIWA